MNKYDLKYHDTTQCWQIIFNNSYALSIRDIKILINEEKKFIFFIKNFNLKRKFIGFLCLFKTKEDGMRALEFLEPYFIMENLTCN